MSDALIILAWAAVWVVGLSWADYSARKAARGQSPRRRTFARSIIINY